MTEFIQPPLVAVGPLPNIDTTTLFKPATGISSPIDSFISNTNAINKILTTAAPGEPTPELSSVVVQGYLSAVETYFRTALSRLVHVDPITQQLVGEKTIAFSAAIIRPREMLAEALYEDSFASVKEVKSRLSDIGMKQLPTEVESALEQFGKICHLRHCCVHRFGYLGYRNANELGMRDHKKLIGSLFSASNEQLSDIAETLQQFVKTLNNHIFRFVLDRTIDDQNRPKPHCHWKWSWEYVKDWRFFQAYYQLFASKDGVPKSAEMKEIYLHFKESNAKKVKGMKSREAKTSAASETNFGANAGPFDAAQDGNPEETSVGNP